VATPSPNVVTALPVSVGHLLLQDGGGRRMIG
jgi:hypothetical protein